MRKKEGKYINCLKCGKEFYTILSRYLSGRSKYCSVSCATYGRLGKSWSGEANERRSITLKTKMQNGEIKKRIGENHPMWKGGKEVLKEYWRPIKRHWLAKKRAKLKNAMPKWLSENDMIEIKNIYKKAAELSKKIAKNKFDFNDFMDQLKQIQKMGNLKDIMKIIDWSSNCFCNNITIYNVHITITCMWFECNLIRI
jgi:hypothetical protein